MMALQINEIFENFISPDKLTDLPSSAGLILFATLQDSPILLLTAANIRRVAKNKLSEPLEKTKKTDLKSITAKIYYKPCPCKFRLAIQHYKAVKQLFPSAYKDYISFVSPFFLTVDSNDKIPFFSITRKPVLKSSEKVLGPFPTQKSASIFLNAIRDVFKLCKGNYTSSKGCPYLQMDACCGVCANKITPDEYRNIINDAFAAGSKPEKQIEKLQAEMQTASTELIFEKAAEIKRKIEKLSVLKNPSYRWTSDLEKLKIIHIDKSGKIKNPDVKKKIQTYACFVINFFDIIDIGDFAIGQNDKVCEEIQNASKRLDSCSREITAETLEKFSIISYFLYRSKPAGLWLKADEHFDIDKLDLKAI